MESEPTPPNNDSALRNQRRLLIILTVALAAWGTYHAVGAYYGGFGEENLRYDFRRSLMVLGCMAVFLIFWWILILTRKPRKKDQPEKREV